MEEQVLTAALAGLLSNRRVEQIVGPYVPASLQKYRADWAQSLAVTVQTITGSKPAANTSAPTRLMPVLSRVQLKAVVPEAPGTYAFAALQVTDGIASYPVKSPQDQADPWRALSADLDMWQRQPGWINLPPEAYFTTLLAFLRKHLWCVAADPQSPDVPLYDQLRLVSALAACLAPRINSKTDQPIALVARGDLSGIQNFIYRIARPEAETEHVAKRLRGRSFYLSLLVEVAVDWLLRELNLPPNCALFVGGGRFDLLLPLAAQGQLMELSSQLEDWLLREFQGELGVHIVTCEARPIDFADMRSVYQTLDERLERSKRRKWINHITDEMFLTPEQNVWHVCRICQLTPLPEPGTCRQCSQHARIGKHLPHAAQLMYCYGNERLELDEEQIVQFAGSPFGVRVAIVRHDDAARSFLQTGGVKTVYQLNDTAHFAQDGVGSSFRFLANVAPRALERIKLPDDQPIEKDDVLHFEAIAELSTGAKRLGILKADVDFLGLVMSEGLASEQAEGTRPTIGRVAALSSMLEVFFAGHLNRICMALFDEWKTAQAQLPEPERNVLAAKVNGLFYVMYSGGDDLFVVGPWDQTLKLAQRIHDEFTAFTGNNPNLTLSAGVAQVKPRYPTQKFAELADEAEKAAKNAGRDRVTAFGQTVAWSEHLTFGELLAFAGRLTRGVQENRVPRTLIADLGRMQRSHRRPDGSLKPMWTPRLYYTLARRLNEETRKELEADLIAIMKGGNIMIPVSYVSLITRKE